MILILDVAEELIFPKLYMHVAQEITRVKASTIVHGEARVIVNCLSK